jgi:hypothetical protein
MVHALEEIRRVLNPDGILIDLRPLADRWPVEVLQADKYNETGRLTDLPSGPADDAAANHAIDEASNRGWFVREQEQAFPFFYYWDNPSEMIEHIAGKWGDFVSIDEDVRKATESAWAGVGGNKRLRLRVKMMLSVWRKN